jgi:hypothetical protein
LAVEPIQCTDAGSDFDPPVLAEKQLPTLEHTQQSPDLAPRNFFFSRTGEITKRNPFPVN